jgi:hypothetical protein
MIDKMNQVEELEYQYCAKEEAEYWQNPTEANKIAVLCKRDEFNRALIRKLIEKINE